MSSYLEAYGAAEQKRARTYGLVKRYAIIAGGLLLAAVILYAIFKNHSEEQQAKNFISLLQAHNYQAAYQLWGCSEQHPCKDYLFDKFMDDWGPKSSHADATPAHIGLSQSCGAGVLIRLDYRNSVEPVPLYVDRDTKIISFAPWVECPGRHLHIGAWLRSVFGK